MVEEVQNREEVGKTSSSKKVKIQFLKSPTGAYGLGYNAGDTVSLPNDTLTKRMIKEGAAAIVK